MEVKLQTKEVKTSFSTQTATQKTIREVVVEVDLIEEEKETEINLNAKFVENLVILLIDVIYDMLQGLITPITLQTHLIFHILIILTIHI